MVQRSFRFMTTSLVSDLSMFICPEGESCPLFLLSCLSFVCLTVSPYYSKCLARYTRLTSLKLKLMLIQTRLGDSETYFNRRKTCCETVRHTNSMIALQCVL